MRTKDVQDCCPQFFVIACEVNQLVRATHADGTRIVPQMSYGVP